MRIDPSPQPGDAPSAGTAAASVISMTDAAFGYDDRPVISGVTLDIAAGEVVAITGPNGSGKSTIVKGLLGLSQQLGGRVELFGVDRAHFHEHTRLGYVPQRHTLSHAVPATVREVVGVGRLPHLGWFSRPGRRDRQIVDEALELVGLADRAREDVSTLSGGQHRRVLIARALASQPEVLLMDEPTAGVDVANQHVLADVLGRLAERGTTMVIVTHEMDALTGFLTRVVCTRNGAVDFDGDLAAYAHRHEHPGEPRGGHHHFDEEPPTRPRPVPDSGPADALRRLPHG